MLKIGTSKGISLLNSDNGRYRIGKNGGGASITLNVLSLSNSTFYDNATPGTVIGSIIGKTSGSTITINPSDSRVALSGNNVVVGLGTLTAGTFSITLRETLAGATNTPKDTVINMTINAYISLNTLTLSASSFTVGASAGTTIGAIQNKTSGSTLSLTDSHSGAVSISGTNLVVGATPPGSAGTFSITIRETLAGSVNTPKDTTLTITENAASITLTALTLSNANFNMNASSGTVIGAIQNKTSGSTLSLTNDHSGAVAISGTNLVVGSTNTPTTGSWNVTIRETLAGATNTPLDTTLSITVNPYTDAAVSAIDALGWQITTPTPPSVFTNKIVAVNAPGYDSSGNSITLPTVQIPIKARLRQPAPNDALMTSQTCYLAEAVTSADTIVGSGVTNNSTESYPLCIANWASGDYYVVGNSVTVYLTAFHYYGIAYIVGTADDTNGHTATASTTTQIVLPGNDASKIVGYALTFNVSTFTDKRNFTVNAKIYPKRGNSSSVLDSSASTTITGSSTTRNFGPRFYRKDTTLAASPIYGYVSPSGNDGTGVVSTTAATALASPFATLDGARVALKNSTLSGKAANSDDGCIIRLMAGSHALNNMTTFTNGSTSALTVEAAPGESSSTVTLTSNATAPALRLNWIRFRNIKLARGGAGFFASMLTATSSKVFTEDCAIDNNNQITVPFGTYMASISGGTATSGGSSGVLLGASTGCKFEMIRGVTFATPASAAYQIDSFNVIGCVGNFVSLLNTNNVADNTTVAFNKFYKQTAVCLAYSTPTAGANISGIAVVQNLFEWTGSVTNPNFRPSGDGETTNMSNILIISNTFAGMDTHGRENAFYDETSSTTRRTHKWILDINNGKVSANTKVDRFVYYGQSNSDAPNRIGGWWHAFGVGARNNHHRYRNAQSGNINFGPEDFGLNTTAPITNTPPGDDPKFVSYAGTTGTTASPVAGTGVGDYHLQSGSPYIGKVPAVDQYLDYDLDGVARKKDGTGACGAYEY